MEDVDECELGTDVERDELVVDFVFVPLPKLIMETLRIPTITIAMMVMNAAGRPIARLDENTTKVEFVVVNTSRDKNGLSGSVGAQNGLPAKVRVT